MNPYRSTKAPGTTPTSSENAFDGAISEQVKTDGAMDLTRDEREVLDGSLGEIPRKLLLTMVRFGEAMDAERLVPVEGPGHLVIPESKPGVGARTEFLESLVDAGVRAALPFTADPATILNETLSDLTDEQRERLARAYPMEVRYREALTKLGLRDAGGLTCTPWFEEVANRPSYGQIVAWAESSAVVYANSVIGARTHRNPGIIDLISNVVGKTPLAGLLTDEGRRASWLVEVEAAGPINGQVLGYLIGREVGDGIPWVTGLADMLEGGEHPASGKFLRDFGTNASVGGGVGLFHVEGVTVEAKRYGRRLIRDDARRLTIDAGEIESVGTSLRADRPVEELRPNKVLLGCPHLTYDQLCAWTDAVESGLARAGRDRLAVETVFVAAPEVVSRFRAEHPGFAALALAGGHVGSFCLEAFMQDPILAPACVVTNSNKLRYYSRNVYMLDDEALLRVMVTGGTGAAAGGSDGGHS